MSEAPWLIVGLGNPGREYGGTPHNIGEDALFELARRCSAELSPMKKVGCLVATGLLRSHRVVFAAPMSYMNLSGPDILNALRYYSGEPDRLIVIHDDLDLPLGAIRLKIGGGDAGHNGLKSIRGSLGNGDYVRVRVGIDRPPGRVDPANYVLRRWPSERRAEVAAAIDDAATATEILVGDGISAAQQTFHQSGRSQA